MGNFPIGLILHHSNDLDGYGSSVIAIKYLEDQNHFIQIKTIPVNYNVYDFERIKQVIKESNGKVSVFILDFTFSLEEMKWLVDNCYKFYWTDHHPTVLEIKNEIVKYIKTDGTKIFKNVSNNKKNKYFINFDNENEFAAIYLTFQMLYPQLEVPKFVKYISNLDLWKMDEEDIVFFREFTHKLPWKNYKFLKKYIFDEQIINSDIKNENLFKVMKTLGNLFIQRKKEQIEKASKRFVTGKIENYNVCIVNNTNSEINNEVLNYMCSEKGYDIAISYFDDLYNGKRGFSLRSVKEENDVSMISKRFNGGGHIKASGFSVPLIEGIKFVDDLINFKL